MARSRGRKANQHGRSEGQPRFILLPYWMLETAAFLSLTPAEVCVLLFLLKRFDGSNNGKIGFGVRSGCFVPLQGTGKLVDRRIPVTRSGIGRALEALQAFGFIACTQPATFNQKRLTREWRLTWLRCDGQVPTSEFARLSATECQLIRSAQKNKSQSHQRD